MLAGDTGKSFLIKTIKCWIKQNLNKDTAISASTFITAFNINSLTIHRLLQLPIEHVKFQSINNCLIMYWKFYEQILRTLFFL